MDTSGDAATGTAHLRRPGAVAGHGEEPPVDARSPRRRGVKTGPWSQGPALLQQLAVLAGLDLPHPAGSADRCTPSWRARSSRLPTATPGTATRPTDVPLDDAAVRRLRRRAPVAHRRGRPTTARSPAPRAAARRGCPVLSRAAPRRPTGAGAGRADRRDLERRDPRRHLPPRRRGPLATWSRDAQRRLAAVLAGGPALGFPLPAPGPRCSGSSPGCRTPSRPGAGRAPRSPRPSCCATTARRASPSGRPAATSRTSGSCSSSLAHLVCGLDLQEAIDAPTGTPSTSLVLRPARHRPGLPRRGRAWATASLAELRRRGHDVTVAGPWSLGRLCAVGGPGRDAAGRRRPRAACRATRSGAERRQPCGRIREDRPRPVGRHPS